MTLVHASVLAQSIVVAFAEFAHCSNPGEVDTWPGDLEDQDLGCASGAVSLLQVKLESRRSQSLSASQVGLEAEESGQALLGSFSAQEGHVLPFGADLAVKMMTLEQAKASCVKLTGCKGFAAKGDASAAGLLEIHFKNEWDGSGGDWTSFGLAGASSRSSQAGAEVSSMSTARKLQKDVDYRFDAVDGGMGRACRGSGVTDSRPEYYSVTEAASLDICQEACVANDQCGGVEYNLQSQRCRVWTREGGIGLSSRATRFFQCHRLVRLSRAARSYQAVAAEMEAAPLGPLLQLVEDGHITPDAILHRTASAANMLPESGNEAST